MKNLVDYDMVVEYKDQSKQVEMLVDLKEVQQFISEIQLSFQENKDHVKMMVTINSIDQNGKSKREYYRMFEETVVYVSKVAYSKDNNQAGCIYRDSPNSSYLGIQDLQIENARYLQIIIGSAFVSHTSMKCETFLHL